MRARPRGRPARPDPDRSDSHGTGRADAARPGLAARRVAATVLAQVIDERTSLDALLDVAHGMAGFLTLDGRDRALVRAIVTTALRQRGPITRALARFLDRPLPRGARHLEHLLHVAAAQILYLDVADRAAIDLAVSEANDPRSRRFKGLVNAVLRRVSENADALRDPPPDPGDVAPWLAKAWRSDFGRERMLRMIAAQRQEPPLDLTVARDGPLPPGERLATGTLRTRTRAPVSQLPGYADGHWWVQDAAATLPAHLLGDVRGARVLDLCAAPGGKTMQLAARGARVTAVELVANRLERLRENLERTRLAATLVHADALEVTADGRGALGGPFDAVLLDAPCSSTGTIRRHPDVAWTKTADDVTALAALQERLLVHALTLLRPGGTLVFANCSTLKREGEDLFARVRERSDVGVSPVTPGELWGMNVVTGQGTVRTLPHHAVPLADQAVPLADQGVSLAQGGESPGMDGFFCARITVQS